MKTKVLFLGLVIASMASANAQTFNKNNYAFEVGKMAANLSVKSSCNCGCRIMMYSPLQIQRIIHQMENTVCALKAKVF